MADFADVASDYADRLLEHNLTVAARQRQPLGAVSARECVDCDDPIPEARRLAVPGCQLCVECQGLREVRR